MTDVRFYPFDEALPMKFAVLLAFSGGKQVFCRHRDRVTWEFPGGHREPGEAICETAARELQEETGAKAFSVEPLCVYSVCRDGEETFGGLFRADISEFGPLEWEVAELSIGDTPPGEWTYPEIQPHLLNWMQKNIAL